MQEQASAGALFRLGRLGDAIAAATARLRREPGAAGARVLLAELLLFAGNLERADVQLDTAGTVDPSLSIAVAEFRQLLRAERARHQLLTEGRVPEFLDGPTEAQRAALAAAVALRAGDPALAARHAAAAEAARPAAAFILGDQAGEQRVDDLRDADDLIGGSLEVLTPTGKYLWVPFERVVALHLPPPERPRDLYWRRARLQVEGGPDGEVYVPALYMSDGLAAGAVASGDAADDEALRLGKVTDWRELADGLTLGVGQRVLFAGEAGVPVMELTSLTRVA